MPAIVAARAVRAWLSLLGIGALAVALAGCAWLDERQREIALRPSPTQPAHVAAAQDLFRPGDLRELMALPGGQQLALWWLPAASAEAPALLYLHGTFRNLYQNAPKIRALREAGFAILAVDYRGWGDSTPLVPSEASIHEDARRAWDELRQRQPDPSRRLIYGHSMGGAVAVALASQLQAGRDYRALIVESTFTRMPDVAAEAGLVGRVGAAVTTLQFDSLSRIGRVDAPILLMHGDADTTVPVQLGRRLRDAAPPGATWVEFPGGSHSRLQQEHPEAYQSALRAFVRATDPSLATKTRPATPSRATSP